MILKLCCYLQLPFFVHLTVQLCFFRSGLFFHPNLLSGLARLITFSRSSFAILSSGNPPHLLMPIVFSCISYFDYYGEQFD